jgi:predicted short-subunit dehydrogenase-like oxidoreductase (DUF2520 family)
MTARELEHVFVFGAGKVGAGLARALRRAHVRVTLRPKRAGLPASRIEADLVVLALRDRDLGPCAEELAARGLVGRGGRPSAVVHCAGALGPEVLAPARGPRVAVAQMHPMISFAGSSTSTATRPRSARHARSARCSA